MTSSFIALQAMAGDGTLLNLAEGDFEVIGHGVVHTSEVPGVELEFECQLGATDTD